MDKIAFISDLHIANISAQTLGISTQKNFENTLQFIKNRDYQRVVLGGDLCNNVGERFIYAYVKEKMDSLGIPYYIISGNHDDSTLLSEVMGVGDKLEGGQLYFKEKFNTDYVYFLDTSLGNLSEAQWSWLDKELSNVKGTEAVIFMHHPPIKAYSLHMEPRYEFSEMKRFEDLTVQYLHLKFRIFTGHYHMERTLFKNNIQLYVSPSTYVQIDPDFETFQPIMNGPLFREIIFSEGGGLSTRIVHVS